MNITNAKSKSAWDQFVTSHPEANFLQSWDFYEFYQARGNEIVRRIATDDDGKIIATYAGVVEHAKRGRHLAIAGGPILDWTDDKLVKAIFKDIAKQGQEQFSATLVSRNLPCISQLNLPASLISASPRRKF